MQEIVAVDIEGKSETMVPVPTTLPFCIDWQAIGNMGRRTLIVKQYSAGEKRI